MIQTSLLCIFSFLSLAVDFPLCNSEGIKSIQFSIPLHKDPQNYLKYIENVRQIQTETQTDIQVVQMVIIKGNDEKVEEARRRVSQINTTLDQDKTRENKELHQILKDIKDKIVESECKNAQIKETMKNLIADVLGIKNNVEDFHKKVGVEMAQMSKIVQKNQHDLNGLVMRRKDEISETEDVDLEAFYKSESYMLFSADNKPLICVASALGRWDVVKKLVETGSSIIDKDIEGNTPLHYSSAQGQLGVVKYLLSINAPIDERNFSGETALVMAVTGGKINVVEYLCSKKANAHIKNNHNRTAIDYARLLYKTRITKILEKCASN